MSSLFPETVYHLFGSDREDDVECFAWEGGGQPVAVRITARSAEECILAVKAIEASPASFVVYDGWRYTSLGSVEPYDPAFPANADELYLDFDVEYLGIDDPGYRPRVYIFTCDLQTWERARKAVKHLLQLSKLPPQSYIELKTRKGLQGISAGNLDANPDQGAAVAFHRETAMYWQNG